MARASGSPKSQPSRPATSTASGCSFVSNTSNPHSSPRGPQVRSSGTFVRLPASETLHESGQTAFDGQVAEADIDFASDALSVLPKLRSLPELSDGVTIVPRAAAFRRAVQDLAQPLPGTVPIIDPHES